MRTSVYLALALCTSVGTLGCNHETGGSGDGGTAIPGLTSITITPPTATLTLSGTTPVSLQYSAMGTFEDGHSADVTGQVSWSLGDPSLGSFTGSVFTSFTAHGGTTGVMASSGSNVGNASLTVVLQQRYSDPGSTGLPADPGPIFNGPPSTDDTVVPRFVYPSDNVLVPPNLGQLEFHFTPGGDGSAATPNTLFELSFGNSVTDVKVYLRCPTPPAYTDAAMTPAVLRVAHGCVYTPDAQLWSWIAETNRGREPVTVTVRGTTDAGTAVGSSNSTHISFSLDDIQGALYYWEIGADQPCVNGAAGATGPGCSTSDTTAIVRFDFAAADKAGTTFLTPATPGSTNGTCLGCHALSRDGKKLVAEAGGQGDGRPLLWDVGKEMGIVPFLQADKTLFESWNPDGSQYVGVSNFPTDNTTNAGGTACVTNGGTCDLNLRIYDGTTAKFVADVPGTSVGNLPTDDPDWSADGNSIAYTLVGKLNGNVTTTLQQAYHGSVYTVSQSGGTWGTPVPIAVPPDEHTNYYYPAFAPDNSFLVFNRAVCPAAAAVDSTCWFDTAPTSRLFAAKPTAGATLVELANANKGGALDTSADVTNSYPKWSPFVFRRTGEFGSRLMWLTFASKRHFGLRGQPAVLSRGTADGEVLWMAAVDPDQIANGQDGSFVAFAVPSQRLYKSNHIAQWTSKIVPPIQ